MLRSAAPAQRTLPVAETAEVLERARGWRSSLVSQSSVADPKSSMEIYHVCDMTILLISLQTLLPSRSGLSALFL